MNKNRKLDDEQIEKVSGGGFFSPYDDEDYHAAGVEIIGPGKWYNDGYKFQGQEIKSGEATILVEFFFKNGRIASSVEEAMDWFNSLPDESKFA